MTTWTPQTVAAGSFGSFGASTYGSGTYGSPRELYGYIVGGKPTPSGVWNQTTPVTPSWNKEDVG